MKRFRKTANLSESIHQQLSKYALAASAAGVGMLTQPAEAKIVYTPVHHVIGRNERYKVDLNHDKIGDLSLVNTYGCNNDYCVDALSAFPAAGNGVEGKYGLAYALLLGAKVGSKQPFTGQVMALSSSSVGTFGQWFNVSNRYLGVRFDIQGKTHYGWLRLSVRVLGHAKMITTLSGYAYETIPNKPIIAGKTKGPEEITQTLDAALPATSPQPSTLSALAMGAPGLSIWRREEERGAQ
jgi:hypothetical protein